MSFRAFVAAILFSPIVASATLQVGSDINCSGDLSINVGLDLPDSVVCSGNLSFSGASMSSDTTLSITAADDLAFYGVSVFAPSLNFQAGGALTLDAKTILNATNINLSAGALSVLGQISSVPEPSTLLLLVTGLTVLVALTQKSTNHQMKCTTIGKSVISHKHAGPSRSFNADAKLV